MKIAAYTIFGISILISILHLIFCFLENERLRKITKVFCVSSLALAIALYSPKSYLIYIGAAFGALGDYFLIYKKNTRLLFYGIISFFIGHCLYASQIIIYMQMPNWGIILLAILEIILIISSLWGIYPKKEAKFSSTAGPGIAYFVLLGSMLVFSIVSSIVTMAIYPAILYILGYVIFLSSDITLTITSYDKIVKRDNFYIMLTYLVAQYLITIGLVLTCLPL